MWEIFLQGHIFSIGDDEPPQNFVGTFVTQLETFFYGSLSSFGGDQNTHKT